MPQFLIAPEADWVSDRLNTLTNARLVNSTALTSLTNGVGYRAVLIENLSPVFTPTVAAIAVPAVTSAPFITGTPEVGQILTCYVGTWSNTPTGFTYQMMADFTDIPGATGTVTTPSISFTLTEAQIGKAIRIRVIAENTGGTSTAVTSSATGLVTAAEVPVVLTLFEEIMALSTTSGALSGTVRKIPGVDTQTGVRVSGQTVFLDPGVGRVSGWDFRGYTLRPATIVPQVDDCLFGSTVGVKPSLLIDIYEGSRIDVLEYCTFDGLAGAFSQQCIFERGSSDGLSGHVVINRRNKYVNGHTDYLKGIGSAAPGGQIIEYNDFGQLADLPQTTPTVWNSSTTYALGAHVISSAPNSLEMVSKVNGNLNNSLPTGTVDTAFWDVLDNHIDLISPTQCRWNGLTIRRNKVGFATSSNRHTDINNAIRIGGNAIETLFDGLLNVTENILFFPADSSTFFTVHVGEPRSPDFTGNVNFVSNWIKEGASAYLYDQSAGYINTWTGNVDFDTLALIPITGQTVVPITLISEASFTSVDNGASVTYKFTDPVVAADANPNPVVMRTLTVGGVAIASSALTLNAGAYEYTVTKGSSIQAVLMTYTIRHGRSAQVVRTVSANVPVNVTEPITFTVIDTFNSMTGRTISALPAVLAQGTPIIGPNGAAQISLNGANSFANVKTPAMPWTQVGPNDLIVVAFDNPDDPMQGGYGGVGLTINTNFLPTGDTAAGEVTPYTAMGRSGTYSPGAGFNSWAAQSIRHTNWAGVTLDSLPSGTLSVDSRNDTTAIAGSGNVKFGPIYRVTQRRKSILVPTFDDAHTRELSVVIPLMETKWGAAVGTSYVPYDLVADTVNTAAYTLGDMAGMKARGWAFGTDSMPTDEPIWSTHGGSIANAISALNAHAANIIATGCATADDVKHVCFSYGARSVDLSMRTVALCSTNGTTTITTTAGFGANFFSCGAARGTIVKGPGIPANTKIVSCPNQNTLIVDTPIPTSTNITIAFCGSPMLTSPQYNMTINGTATITNMRTTGLVPGMAVQGRGVPGGTVIVSINTESTGTATDGSITVSNAIPSNGQRLFFYVADAEWLPGRIEAAMLAAGYKSAVTTGSGGICTQFGIPDPLAMLSMSRLSWEGTPATAIASMTQAIRDGRDIVTLMHAVPTMNATNLGLILDFVQARVVAGDLDVMTVPAWYNRIAARSGVA